MLLKNLIESRLYMLVAAATVCLKYFQSVKGKRTRRWILIGWTSNSW